MIAEKVKPVNRFRFSGQTGFAIREILCYASVLNCPSPADRARHARIALACFG
jgi:hypothetical protein